MKHILACRWLKQQDATLPPPPMSIHAPPRPSLPRLAIGQACWTWEFSWNSPCFTWRHFWIVSPNLYWKPRMRGFWRMCRGLEPRSVREASSVRIMWDASVSAWRPVGWFYYCSRAEQRGFLDSGALSPPIFCEITRRLRVSVYTPRIEFLR